MHEETLVNHHRHTDAILMNILVEMEMRLRKLEIVRFMVKMPAVGHKDIL